MINENMTIRTHLYISDSLRRQLILLAVAIAVVCPALAQKNPFGINDKLYNMYIEAYRISTKPQSLDMARDMYSQALQSKSIKS